MQLPLIKSDLDLSLFYKCQWLASSGFDDVVLETYFNKRSLVSS